MRMQKDRSTDCDSDLYFKSLCKKSLMSKFNYVKAVLGLGLLSFAALVAMADPPVPGPPKPLLKCTGDTESSETTQVDCEEDPTLCAAPSENGLCVGDRIVWGGDSGGVQACTQGAAVSNWELVNMWCAKTTECMPDQNEEGDPICTPSGQTTTAYVQDCRKLPEGCVL